MVPVNLSDDGISYPDYQMMGISYPDYQMMVPVIQIIR